MRFSRRFRRVEPTPIVITVMVNGYSQFHDAQILGVDISQSNKIRYLVKFTYYKTVLLALVYPYLPLVVIYNGGLGKRYDLASNHNF